MRKEKEQIAATSKTPRESAISALSLASGLRI
jgi:hypothetical protein